MQHLSLDTLARLLEEPPAATETTHLEACAACRAELDGLRRQAEALRRLGPIEPPDAAWPELADRLEREGLVAPVAGGGAFHRPRPWSRSLLRIAAALVLYAAGAGTVLALRLQSRPATVATNMGAGTTVTAPRGRTPAATTPAAVQAGTAASLEPAPAAATSAPTPAPVTTPENASNARLAAAGATDRANPVRAASAATPEEAIAAVRAAEQQYLAAYTRYAELTGAQQMEDPVTRVAALESIVLTTRQALDRAPADPVINGYHLTAVAQRDATLRQIALRSDGRWF